MENASKALIIAGATLIAVMLISLTMWFLNMLRDYNSKIASQERVTQIESINRFFTFSRPNDGKITGSEMINIIGKARDYNLVYQDPDHMIQVTVDGVHFSSLELPNVSNFATAIPDSVWNIFVDQAKASSDELLYTPSINYSYELDNQGKVSRVIFSGG